MRDTEFRGINVYTNEFVYGNFVNNDVPYRGSRQKVYQIVNEDGIHINVLPTTVGQYIGRKDSKGVKIYEGDILKTKDLYDTSIPVFLGSVEFRDCSFVINQGGFCYHYRWMDYEVEVIGNIYENKELLESLSN